MNRAVDSSEDGIRREVVRNTAGASYVALELAEKVSLNTSCLHSVNRPSWPPTFDGLLRCRCEETTCFCGDLDWIDWTFRWCYCRVLGRMTLTVKNGLNELQ
jgi:hypothetical protein